MNTITSKEAQNRFGELIDKAQREPITVTRRDRPVVVVMSSDRYEELEALEDALWAARAKVAAESGYASEEEIRNLFRGILGSDADTTIK